MAAIRSRSGWSRILSRRSPPSSDTRSFCYSVELDTFRYCGMDSSRKADACRWASRRICRWSRLSRNICSCRFDLLRRLRRSGTDSSRKVSRGLCRSSCHHSERGNDIRTRRAARCTDRACTESSRSDRSAREWKCHGLDCTDRARVGTNQTSHSRRNFWFGWKSVRAPEADSRSTFGRAAKPRLHSSIPGWWVILDCRSRWPQQKSFGRRLSWGCPIGTGTESCAIDCPAALPVFVPPRGSVADAWERSLSLLALQSPPACDSGKSATIFRRLQWMKKSEQWATNNRQLIAFCNKFLLLYLSADDQLLHY